MLCSTHFYCLVQRKTQYNTSYYLCQLVLSRDAVRSWSWPERQYFSIHRMWSDRLLGEQGIQGDNAPGKQQFERRMEARRLEETDEEALKVFRRGWCLGSQEFREQLLEKMEGKLADNHAGQLETAQARANRILAEE